MFTGALRRHARLGAAVLSAPLAGWALNARAEQRVYVSGEALGRGVRLELWKAKHENVVVLDLESELIQLGMTRVRDRENEGARFVHDANAVIRSALDLALTELPNDEEAVITTPRGHKTEGVVFEDDVKVCGITLGTNAEVQKSMTSILQAALPYDSPIGEVLIEETMKGDYKLAKAALPDDLDGYEVILLVPNFNAIERVNKIMHLLRQEGVEEGKITVVTLVTCPEAADSFCQTFGDARLITASFDAGRDSGGFIIPGMGDFDARYLGAASPELDPSEVESDDNGDDKDGDEGIVKKLTSWWPFK